MNDKRDGFLFPRGLRDVARFLPEEERLATYEAILDYALDGVEPALTGNPQKVFSLLKPHVRG